ncbi:transglycosylase SLT domain-containing protein [Methylobacterium sp. NEAU 140]|uniref:transglycosylase SLT domain-containing protein n=1 Tax=Methylobacterium sp. NEAU 140 TaxID=3064945 RepID=UPI00273279A8|nr:transglycosylase SLT domain-containing protein [Methylobacterium sp. NEAU 140]MDP4021559.1 transglycosylase SLT domain-containing protein [Methylobacterium sp. NEAU 140]
MGVFPEPARRADDVSRLAPNGDWGADQTEDQTVAWLPRAGRDTGRRSLRRTSSGRRGRVVAALALLAGLGLPQAAFAPAAFAPAAQAHDRVDLSPRAARALAETASTETASVEAASVEAAPAGDPAGWNGLPVPEQEPATTALVESDLAALPRVTQEADAVRFGGRSVPLKVVDTILKASDEAGVDPVYMMALADKESSFDTDAKAATSSAQGLFQFVSATWLEMIRDFGARYGLSEEAAAVKGRGAGITVTGGLRARVLGLRNDPRVAALMAAELIKRDRGRIEARVGRPLNTTELYLAHFLGTASAGRFLALSSERPDEVAGREFRAAARANRSLFTAKDGAKRRHLTVAELHERIEDMIDRRLNRYRGVTALAGAIESAGESAPADTIAAETTVAEAPAEARRVQVTEALPPDGV